MFYVARESKKKKKKKCAVLARLPKYKGVSKELQYFSSTT